MVQIGPNLYKHDGLGLTTTRARDTHHRMQNNRWWTILPIHCGIIIKIFNDHYGWTVNIGAQGHALLSLLSMVAMHVAFVVWILNQSPRSLRSKRAFFTVGLPASLAIAAEAPVHLLRAKYLAPRRHHCRQFVKMCRPAAMLILWMMLMEVIFANVHSQENGSSHGAVAVNCTRPERGECALYEQTVTECTADPRFFFATPRRLKGLAGKISRRVLCNDKVFIGVQTFCQRLRATAFLHAAWIVCAKYFLPTRQSAVPLVNMAAQGSAFQRASTALAAILIEETFELLKRPFEE